jgi:FkbM family methyltransferase
MELFDKIKIWDKKAFVHLGQVGNLAVEILKNKKNVVVVDVGANTGPLLDVLYMENIDIQNVILFEPQRDLFAYLKIKFKNDDRVVIENIALSDSKKLCTMETSSFQIHTENMNMSDFNLGLSSVYYTSTGNSYTYAFDELAERYKLKKIDFLKIDTETEDLLIVKGFSNTLSELKEKPVIVFENNWQLRHSHNEAEQILNNFCEVAGYNNKIDFYNKSDIILFPI